ncbi:MAG: hypothetical protein BV457_00265 [Thermoplasmata archaeon M9B1D]|nr:MAG: hypothetical protein BV457_00265 [Thermoplasmata archaeon M9B1D]PNX52201.1 MAG: hypothetical protein BV456_00030 [Thermoplasmata archaeon M8B2D]
MFILRDEEFVKEIEDSFNRYALYSNNNVGYVFSDKFANKIIQKFGEEEKFIKKENEKKNEYSLISIEKQLSIIYCLHKRFENKMTALINELKSIKGIEIEQTMKLSKKFSKYFEYYNSGKIFFAVRISNHKNILCNNEYNFILNGKENLSTFIKRCKRGFINKLITFKENELISLRDFKNSKNPTLKL